MLKRQILILHGGICGLTLVALVVAVMDRKPELLFAQGSPPPLQFSSSSLEEFIPEQLSSTSSSSSSTSTSPSSSWTSSSSDSSSTSASTSSSTSDSASSSSSATSDSSTSSSSSSTTSSSSESEESSQSSSPEPEQSYAVEYCGNNVCSSEEGERCDTCPIDCGLCVQDEYPTCGDSVCEAEEISSCIIDCPSSMNENEVRELLRDPEPTLIDWGVIEQAPPESIEDTLESLSRIVRRDERFREKLSKQGATEITASIMGTDNIREVARYINQVTDALKEEAAEVRQTVLNDLFLSPSVSQLMRTLPQREEIIEEAKRGNLVTVQALLPEPGTSTELRLLEVEEYNEMLRKHYPDLFAERRSFRFFPFAKAVEPARSPADAKEGFMDSVFLRKRMEELGIDPNTGLPSLEQDIGNLSERKNILAGIIGIVESDVTKDLHEAEQNMQKPSTKNLINIMGILAYIRSTANFDTLEQTYGNAVARMSTGFQKMQSLFVWQDISPRAEAADLLGEDVFHALTSPDLDEKRSAVKSLMRSQEYVVNELMQKLPEQTRNIHIINLSRVEGEVDLARNQEDLEMAIGSYSNALMMLESEARLQHGLMKRVIYSIQDYFGRSS